jgi:hypothetical protein
MTSTNLPEAKSAYDVLAERLDAYPCLDAEDLTEQTLTSILTATTAEAVLVDPESDGLRDIVGEPFYLVGIKGWLHSQLKGKEEERYLMIDAGRDDGTRFTVTTGSPFASARALQLAKLDQLPRRVKAVELENKRSPGTFSLWIVDAPLPRTTPAINAVATDA